MDDTPTKYDDKPNSPTFAASNNNGNEWDHSDDEIGIISYKGYASSKQYKQGKMELIQRDFHY
ncbi:hypothetical protein NECAME_16706 [Necator americanus]|uniref:Uncharacterized protein n=1 Tax=Necator americanus TaxID=51031 RepID=W2TX89_NECAM|nr:hypothetical protein NECAME_16706 [Necator americanus]ETN85647.1 hypothetical protein NECAME_16706 [Necator americanus]